MQFDADFYQRRLTQQLRTGSGDAQAVAAVDLATVASEAALLAVPDDSDFVRQAYRFFLRRDPDIGGLLYFCEMAAHQGRASVIREIQKSEEASHVSPLASSDTAPASSASADDPAPDPAAADVAPPDPELVGLLGIADDEAFLHEAYRRVLGRPPDPDGLDHHGSRLAAGEARERILHALVSSDEARQRGLAFTWHGEPWRGPSVGTRVRSVLARVTPGAGRRRLRADLRRVSRAHVRIEHSLAELRDRQTQLGQALHELSAGAPSNPDAARAEPALIGALSSHMSQEFQRLADAQRSIQLAVDSLAVRVEAKAAETVRHTVAGGDRIVATMLEGFIVGMPGEEWRLVAYHAFKGVLEPGLTRRFGDSLKPGMIVVDVGANIGMYTLVGARGVGPTGRVYSFEPTPRSFAILRDNIQVNGFLEVDRVRFRRVAISDRQGTARFSLFPANGGHNTLFPGDRGKEVDMIDVDTTTLDAALAEAPHVDVVKIDAEGAEPLIWAGMAGTLARNPQIRVFLEFAPPLLVRAGQDPAAFLHAIEQSGFRIQVVDDLNGSLRTSTYEELVAQISVNLMLTGSPR